jgi:dihydrodipicolinate synthase/N-acetylneuraminate lyase
VTLHGAIAAAATPFTDGATALDAEALGPLVAFLAEGGMDGVLACGTTGEGVLLSAAERRAIVERFLEVRPGLPAPSTPAADDRRNGRAGAAAAVGADGRGDRPALLPAR